MLMQKLWIEKAEWDEPLSQAYLTEWKSYYSSLEQVNHIIIPRNVNPENDDTRLDSFGFGDASQVAFGACIYVVSRKKDNSIDSRLLCSKAKVASLKTISIPRLELEAALLLYAAFIFGVIV